MTNTELAIQHGATTYTNRHGKDDPYIAMSVKQLDAYTQAAIAADQGPDLTAAYMAGAERGKDMAAAQPVQPEQEPVAWQWFGDTLWTDCTEDRYKLMESRGKKVRALYPHTALAQPVQPAPITLEAAIVHLVEALCQSKGWMHAYADAKVRDALEAAPQQAEAVQPAISIDALVAEFEATPKGLAAMQEGRQWVRETLAQAKREWVGLTKQDTWEIAENCGLADEAWLDVMNAIEAKLKERNT